MKVERPRTLLELFSVFKPGTELVAGGTDWVIKRHAKLANDAVVIDVFAVDEMQGISLEGENTEGGFLRIGALETMTSLHRNPLVRRYASALADAAYKMGSEQIRNRATVGGNVANSSPAADTPPALAALGAEAVLASGGGERIVPVEDILGRNRNTLASCEIIKEFRIPLDVNRVSAFLKIGSRSQVSISRVNLAVLARCTDNLFKDARVFVGTLGLAARRVPGAEEALSAAGFDETFPAALATFAAEAIPGRPTLPYKQSALRGLAQDICVLLSQRAREAVIGSC